MLYHTLLSKIKKLPGIVSYPGPSRKSAYTTKNYILKRNGDLSKVVPFVAFLWLAFSRVISASWGHFASALLTYFILPRSSDVSIYRACRAAKL
jgi:hypothetical protein